VNFDAVEKIAEAVLYEGYMLYPYRRSSVKNQQRWNFGVLSPRSYSELQQGSDAWSMQTECLVKAGTSARLVVKLRFLQIVRRSIGKLRHPGQELTQDEVPEFDLVERLEMGGRVYESWEEAAERQHTTRAIDLASVEDPLNWSLDFRAGEELEYLRDEQGETAGVIVRDWKSLTASISLTVQGVADGVFKLRILVSNHTTFASSRETKREEALAFSLVSAHTILGIEDGEFISLLEPPAEYEELAARCKNIGTWPVLVGEGAERMLSSPIILYDHPQIAPESAGNFFDSTEIDEILSLRIMTLTDEEKQEMRQSDDRAREILDRTEAMPEEQFMKLHGVLRGLSPAKEISQ
jgi:hydrogenase maturation protease